MWSVVKRNRLLWSRFLGDIHIYIYIKQALSWSVVPDLSISHPVLPMSHAGSDDPWPVPLGGWWMLTKCFENIRLVGQSLIIILAITGPLAFSTLGALSAASERQMLFTSKPQCIWMLWGELFVLLMGLFLMMHLWSRLHRCPHKPLPGSSCKHCAD